MDNEKKSVGVLEESCTCQYRHSHCRLHALQVEGNYSNHRFSLLSKEMRVTAPIVEYGASLGEGSRYATALRDTRRIQSDGLSQNPYEQGQRRALNTLAV